MSEVYNKRASSIMLSLILLFLLIIFLSLDHYALPDNLKVIFNKIVSIIAPLIKGNSTAILAFIGIFIAARQARLTVVHRTISDFHLVFINEVIERRTNVHVFERSDHSDEAKDNYDELTLKLNSQDLEAPLVSQKIVYLKYASIRNYNELLNHYANFRKLLDDPPVSPESAEAILNDADKNFDQIVRDTRKIVGAAGLSSNIRDRLPSIFSPNKIY